MASAAATEAAGSSALEDEIAKAVKEGKGWKEGEREAYLKKVSDEDHPMFAENIEVCTNRFGSLTGLRRNKHLGTLVRWCRQTTRQHRIERTRAFPRGWLLSCSVRVAAAEE